DVVVVAVWSPKGNVQKRRSRKLRKRAKVLQTPELCCCAGSLSNRRKVRSLTLCLAGSPPHNVCRRKGRLKSDHFQPQNRQSFAFRGRWNSEWEPDRTHVSRDGFRCKIFRCGFAICKLRTHRSLSEQSCTAGSNPSPSAIQSCLQRNSA